MEFIAIITSLIVIKTSKRENKNFYFWQRTRTKLENKENAENFLDAQREENEIKVINSNELWIGREIEGKSFLMRKMFNKFAGDNVDRCYDCWEKLKICLTRRDDLNENFIGK